MLNDDEFKLFLKTLGIRIRQLRKEKHFTMRDIMISTGYYDAQWRKYESGGSLNVASLLRIAMALDVSLNELLDGLGQWPRLSVTEITKQNGIPLDSEIEPEPESEPQRSSSPITKHESEKAIVKGTDAHTSPAAATQRKRRVAQ